MGFSSFPRSAIILVAPLVHAVMFGVDTWIYSRIYSLSVHCLFGDVARSRKNLLDYKKAQLWGAMNAILAIAIYMS